MKKLYILFFALAATTVNAQAPKELSSLIQQSFNYFPRIKELDKSAELAELRVDLAKSNYLPTVNGTASYSYISPVAQTNFVTGPNPSDVRTLQFQPNNNVNFNVGLNQVLWDFGKTQAQIEKAKADLLVTKQNTESAKLQVAAQVASIYYSMIYLKQAALVQDSVINYFEESKKVIQGKIKNGDALQIDLSTIDNNISQEQNRKLEFQRLFDRQLALMKFTTGQSAVPTVTEFNFQNATANTVEDNPELLAANERITAAQAELKLAGANKIPTLSLQAGAGFRNGYQPDIFETRFNYLAGATLNIPIFQGGRLNKNNVLAKKSLELNELSKSTLITTLQKDVETSQSDVKAYTQQIKNSEEQINAAKETSRLAQVRYKQGVVTYLDLINASSNLQRSHLNKLQYEYQRTLVQIELARLSGVKFWQE